MIIVWGKRFCGRVDRVPNSMHVATMFGHVYYFPLIPIKSYIVVEPDYRGGEPRYIPIPLNMKSVVAGYLRSILVVGGSILTLIAGCDLMIQASTYGTEMSALGTSAFLTVLGIAMVVGFIVWSKLSYADQNRASYLARQASIPPNTLYNQYRTAR